jgi:short-subunit dehydrogenase
MKILITGATGAFGSELAKAFKGHDLILHGRNKDKFPNVKAGKISGDINDQLTRINIIGQCEDIDVFINNAAVFQNCPLDELNILDIETIIETNLTSPIILLKEVIEIFKKRGSGTIININSVAGKMGNAMEAVYCATKYGMKGFMDSVRFDCIQKGVRVIELFPGAMSTGMAAYREDSENFTDAKELAEFVTHIVDTKTFFPTGIEIHRAIYE